MVSMLTGEEFTYTFKSEISMLQLDGYKALQEKINHVAMKFEGYLGQDLGFSLLPSSSRYLCTARVTFVSLQLGLVG